MKQSALAQDQSGFTVIELLVAMTITSVTIATVVGSVLFNQTAYYEDVLRVRINSNLRSAMDIIAMNIRQAGEHLGGNFPAVEVSDGGGLSPDTLTLRRAMLSEVLTVCSTASAGDTQVYISVSGASDPECLAVNASFPFSRWKDYRAGRSVRAYIYDRVARSGEWLDFQSEGTTSGEYWVGVSALNYNYPAIQSTIYLLEEYSFEVDVADESLVVTVDGKIDEQSPVAFSIATMQVRVELADGSIIENLSDGGVHSWKEIKQISTTLVGRENRRKREFISELTAGYFPRNVLSE